MQHGQRNIKKIKGSVAKDLINNQTQNFTLFMPCIFCQIIHVTKRTKYTNTFRTYLHYNITINIAIYFDSKGTNNRQSNQSSTVQN